MPEVKIKADPVVEYQKYTERLQAEKELAKHKWTLAEVERLRAEAGNGSVETAHRYAALKPYIEASNARGDYKETYQFTRAEAAEYLKSKGVQGEPWSYAETLWIAADPQRFKEYGEIVKAAQREGRLFVNKQSNGNFAGEGQGQDTPGAKAFEKNFNAKLERLDNFNKAAELIQEAQEKAKTLEAEKIDGATMRSYVQTRVKKIQELDSELYPVSSIPGYADLTTALGILEEKFGKRPAPFVKERTL